MQSQKNSWEIIINAENNEICYNDIFIFHFYLLYILRTIELRSNI